MKKNVQTAKSKKDPKRTTNENDPSSRNLEENQLSNAEGKSEMFDRKPTATPRAESSFFKRDKVSDIPPKHSSSIDSKNSSARTSMKFLKVATNEEPRENKWKKFWEHHRDRFRHKSEEDLATRSRTIEEMTAEVDAVFRKAIRTMRLDRTDTDRRSFNTDETSPEKDDLINDESISELSQNVDAPPRRLKLNMSRAEDRKLYDASADDQGAFKKRFEENDLAIAGSNDEKQEASLGKVDFFVGINDEEKNQLKDSIRSVKSRRWSSLENLGRKVKNVEEDSCGGGIEDLSIERPVRGKEKRTIGSLRSSLERKMGSVERILEDQVEKMWEQNLEKHPWLLPIESWINERCRSSSGTRSVVQNERNSGLEVEDGESGEKQRSEQNYDFKFTRSEEKDEEGRVEIKLDHLKKPESDGVNLISKLKRSLPSEQSKMENQEVLVMKDVKHHDLFDKLKDNVKEKMEDIHRVDWDVSFFFLFI